MSGRIAICNPCLNGDTLWSVPAARAIAQREGRKADFWISWRARPIADLLAVQEFVEDVCIDESWWPAPDAWEMMAPQATGRYSGVYQLGLRPGLPIKGWLLDHFCEIAQVPRQEHRLDLPPGFVSSALPAGRFVSLVAKANRDPRWDRLWGKAVREFVRRCPLPVVECDQAGHAVCVDVGAIDCTCVGFLAMAEIIARSSYFVGTISGPLVVADAFRHVTRIVFYDPAQANQLQNLGVSPPCGMNHYVTVGSVADADKLLACIK